MATSSSLTGLKASEISIWPGHTVLKWKKAVGELVHIFGMRKDAECRRITKKYGETLLVMQTGPLTPYGGHTIASTGLPFTGHQRCWLSVEN